MNNITDEMVEKAFSAFYSTPMMREMAVSAWKSAISAVLPDAVAAARADERAKVLDILDDHIELHSSERLTAKTEKARTSYASGYVALSKASAAIRAAGGEK